MNQYTDATTYPNFIVEPIEITKTDNNVNRFTVGSENIDFSTVEAFGDEWTKFDHFSDNEIDTIARDHYFDIVPVSLYKNKQVLDVGCGTGRWTKFVAKEAGTVDAVDPSKAIDSAARLLKGFNNVRLSQVGVSDLPFDDNTFDLVFSLGVLHHIPDTQRAMEKCVEKVKPGGYFLTYLYYRFDNRGFLFKSLFGASNLLRKFISHQQNGLKNFLCDCLAVGVYMPFVATGKLLKMIRLNGVAKKMPLHFYIDKTFNIIKNDARDRFGTPLEQRFTRDEIMGMMTKCGLSEIVFSDNEPYWHALGKKA